MKLMLATPAYRGIQCLPFLDSLQETVELLLSRGVGCEFHMIAHNPYVQTARNALVQMFLRSDCDKLLFLDDDLSWDAEDVWRLLQADKPFAAGIYSMKSDVANYPCVLKCDKDGRALTDGPYLLATRAATGFMMVDRSVFAAIREAFPRLAYMEMPNIDGAPMEEFFDYFPQGVHNGRWIGEDYAFCSMWEQLGGIIYIIPDMTFGHHGVDEEGKPHTWTGNLLHYLRRQPGGSEYAQDQAPH